MRNIAAIVASLLSFFLSFIYCYFIWRDQIEPVMTTWLLFCVSVSLSFWTYWASEKHSLIGNIGNLIDMVLVWSILFAIVFLGKADRFNFNSVEIGCLIASGIILIYWRRSRKHIQANIALQTIMVIAYAPLFYKLWFATQNPELVMFWALGCVTSCFALVPAFIDRDKLAVLYSMRALIMSLFVLLLIYRISGG